MSGLCKDCKHWELMTDAYGKPRDWGQCAKTWMKDISIAGIEEFMDPPTDTLAMATDWEGYKAVLETAPNFGCVQFEERG